MSGEFGLNVQIEVPYSLTVFLRQIGTFSYFRVFSQHLFVVFLVLVTRFYDTRHYSIPDYVEKGRLLDPEKKNENPENRNTATNLTVVYG